jgi:uncharacterized repeat protein (TIGR02543 family)
MKTYNKSLTINKLFALLCLLPLLLLTACKGIHQAPVVNESDTALIRIALADETRTAFPMLTANDFVRYKLTMDGRMLAEWARNSDKNISAYEAMNGDPLIVTKAEHTFVLTATESNGASYAGSVTKNITEDYVQINFTLELSSVSPEGTGRINITVNYPVRNVKNVTGTVYKSTDLENYRSADKVATSESSTILGTFTFTANNIDIPVGEYIVAFDFYGGDEIIIGTWLEYVYITSSLTATSVCNISSFDDVYSIIYDSQSTQGAVFTSKPLYYSWQSDIELPEPTKTGKDFTGWYEEIDENGDGIGGQVTRINGTERSGSVKLYATWDDTVYTVIFNENGGTSDIAVQQKLYNEYADCPEEEPLYDGFDFAGWYTSTDNGVTLSGQAYDFENTPINSNLILYARWKYTVSYSANSETATGDMSEESFERYKEDTSSVVLVPNVYENAGYTFLGWATQSDATAAVYGDEGIVPASAFANGNTTMYAIWHSDEDSNFVVSFETFGTNGIASQVLANGEKATEPPIPVKEGFTFLGWFKSEDGGQTLAENEYDFKIIVKSNMTLYAKWVQTGYFVSPSPLGSDIDGDGTKERPFESITEALTKIRLAANQRDYEIVISGKLVGNVTVDDLATSDINSLTIRGSDGNETDILDGNANGSVLTINTNVPVILRDIKITNGFISNSAAGKYKGGAISIGSANYYSTVLKLQSGTLITGNISQYGQNSNGAIHSAAGIYCYSGTIYIEDGAKVINNIAKKAYNNSYTYLYAAGGIKGDNVIMNGGEVSNNTTASSGGGIYAYRLTMNGGKISSNSASYYGGVYVSNSFTLNDGLISGNNSYAITIPSGGTFTMNGGIIKDNSTFGVYNNGTFIMKDGEISNNNGGGVYNYNNGKFTMEGGIITGNLASYGGAIYNFGTLKMTGGEISGNRAIYSGGGINIANGTFTLESGTISDNTAPYGGAVYNSSTFIINGNINIPAGSDGKHDVYLSDPSYITVTAALTSDNVATITPSKYEVRLPLIYASGVAMSEELIDKFILTPEYGSNWVVEIDGNYAEIRGERYNITYKDIGDGDFSGSLPDDAPAAHEFGIETELPVPEKTGYVFIGWFIGWYERNGQTLTEGSAITSLKPKAYRDDITLYAKWVKESSTVEVNTDDIAITYDSDLYKLTASDGFTDYVWYVNGTEIAQNNSVWSVSDDGKVLTYDNDSLLAGCTYFVKVCAFNKNGVLFTTSKTIIRQ